MRSLNLKRIPNNREINTAFHQDEGVVLETGEGQKYTFVPDIIANHRPEWPFGLTGRYCLVDKNDQFTSTQGEAILSRDTGQLHLLD